MEVKTKNQGIQTPLEAWEGQGIDPLKKPPEGSQPFF